MQTRVFLLLISLLIGGHATAQEADPPGGIVAPPDRGTAVSERMEWLVENPEHIAVSEVFSDLLEDTRSIEDLNTVRLRVVPGLGDRELRYNATLALAAVYRTARQLSVARELYRQAYELSFGSPGGIDLESLFASAQILLELGELRRADAEARAVLAQTSNYSLKRRAYTLSARIAYENGNGAGALEMLQTLASLASSGEGASDLVEVGTLLLLRQILQVMGDTDAVEHTDALLVRLFPGSVAAGIVTAESRSITLPGLPSTLLLAQVGDGGDAPVKAGVMPSDRAPAARRDQPRLSGVQVGSFGDSDNAEHLRTDLLQLGLAARTETISREGSTLHQVVVDIADGSVENAAKILLTLRENGFDGFLVY